MNINGLNFKCTCSSCPEQYDVFDGNGNIVGYVRLRWGSLRCEYPDVGGEVIYHAGIGNGWNGQFENEEQRKYHLTMIANKILEKIDM
jgi:hypothetical protein